LGARRRKRERVCALCAGEGREEERQEKRGIGRERREEWRELATTTNSRSIPLPRCWADCLSLSNMTQEVGETQACSIQTQRGSRSHCGATFESRGTCFLRDRARLCFRATEPAVPREDASLRMRVKGMCLSPPFGVLAELGEDLGVKMQGELRGGGRALWRPRGDHEVEPFSVQRLREAGGVEAVNLLMRTTLVIDCDVIYDFLSFCM